MKTKFIIVVTNKDFTLRFVEPKVFNTRLEAENYSDTMEKQNTSHYYFVQTILL